MKNEDINKLTEMLMDEWMERAKRYIPKGVIQRPILGYSEFLGRWEIDVNIDENLWDVRRIEPIDEMDSCFSGMSFDLEDILKEGLGNIQFANESASRGLQRLFKKVLKHLDEIVKIDVAGTSPSEAAEESKKEVLRDSIRKVRDVDRILLALIHSDQGSAGIEKLRGHAAALSVGLKRLYEQGVETD